MKPLAFDLYCGLGGWTDGLLEEGYEVIGFDIQRHRVGRRKYPAQLVLQDILTLHGSQLRRAALIVASPPCQRYSYMSMPWSKGRVLAGEFRTGMQSIGDLNALFWACFRIQDEASEAAGHRIPLVVENVRGAQAWVGKAKARYGSFHLWGDVSTWGNIIVAGSLANGGLEMPRAATKNTGGSWFAVDKRGKATDRNDPRDGSVKNAGHSVRYPDAPYTPHMTDPARVGGIKQPGLSGRRWFDHGAAQLPSHSVRRAEYAAKIAMIPLPLSRFIGRAYKPAEVQ